MKNLLTSLLSTFGELVRTVCFSIFPVQFCRMPLVILYILQAEKTQRNPSQEERFCGMYTFSLACIYIYSGKNKVLDAYYQ